MMMEGGTALYGNLYVLASPWIAPTRDLPCSGKQVQTMVMVMVMVMVISEMVMMIGMMMRGLQIFITQAMPTEDDQHKVESSFCSSKLISYSKLTSLK